MSPSRRQFLRTLGITGALGAAPSFIHARGLESLAGEPWRGSAPFPQSAAIRLDSNENPVGPGPRALAAIQAAFAGVSRYPREEPALATALGGALGVPPGRILFGIGSTEILVNAVRAFTAPERPLVTAHPTFETPTSTATLLGHPVRAVPVRGDLSIDLEAMVAQCRGAGFVFLCNPNNPTGTVHAAAAVRDFIQRVQAASPDAVVMIDEAYHDYVADPGYATAIPLAMADPRVLVARTFSKAYGIAGLRLGYVVGHEATLERMARFRLNLGISGLAHAAGQALLADQGFAVREARRNTEAREWTRAEFGRIGFTVPVSHTNFVMVNIRRDTRAFRAACADQGIRVGRPFPPLDTWSRISIGTMEEMRRAMPLFEKVLG